MELLGLLNLKIKEIKNFFTDSAEIGRIDPA